MTAINNLKIGMRLALAFAAVLALLVLASGIGLHSADRIFSGLKTVYEDRTVPAFQLAEINALTLRSRTLLADRAAGLARDEATVLDRELDDNLARVTKIWETYLATYLTPTEKELADAFAKDRSTYVNDGLLPMRAALSSGQTDAARQIYQDRVVPLARSTQAGMGKLMQLQVDVGAEEFAAASALRLQVLWIGAGTTLAALLLGAALAWLITRSITQPVARAAHVAQAVADGDLTVKIEPVGRDEVAELLRSLARMTERLSSIVGEVRRGSDSIATGSSEVAAGSADLSQRTEQQAASLEQTAAAMEELTSTVKNSADVAGQARELAAGASGAAARGGEVVGRVVTTMQDIAASSQKIAEIIGTIDAIAFQTNVLALNAAVEASRAGDHGRGFAVVASEVRTLAQRSTAAAKEIKTLIGTSVEKIHTGAREAGDAQRSITEIVAQAQRVNHLIGEIADATREQSGGIGQVGQAVGQLDQVTQQNAALVEESAAAAESLSQQAHRLTQLVSRFKLVGSETALA